MIPVLSGGHFNLDVKYYTGRIALLKHSQTRHVLDNILRYQNQSYITDWAYGPWWHHDTDTLSGESVVTGGLRRVYVDVTWLLIMIDNRQHLRTGYIREMFTVMLLKTIYC